MAELSLLQVILATIIGTLAAIVYSLRVLILLERRVAGMELNIQRMTMKILKEETAIKKVVTRRRAPVRRKVVKRSTSPRTKSSRSKKRRR